MDVASEPSYVHGASPVALLGETIGQNLDRTAARVPDNDALVSVHQGVRMTYAQFHAAVEEVARGLLALGIEPGERVGIWSPNNAEWVTLQYATAKVGAILVNVNPSYRSHELRYVVNQSGMRMLVSAVSHKTSDYRGMVDEVRPDCPDLHDVVYIGEDSWTALVERGSGVPTSGMHAGDAHLGCKVAAGGEQLARIHLGQALQAREFGLLQVADLAVATQFEVALEQFAQVVRRAHHQLEGGRLLGAGGRRQQRERGQAKDREELVHEARMMTAKAPPCA